MQKTLQGAARAFFRGQGYISQKLLKDLLEHNLKLFTKIKRNMKNKPVLPHEK
jgi:Transposase DDE domain